MFATDGRLPIDNNWGERLQQRVAVGKKNWLFVGSLRAGIRSANLMTIVASVHRHDLDVQEKAGYFRLPAAQFPKFLGRLPEHSAAPCH